MSAQNNREKSALSMEEIYRIQGKIKGFEGDKLDRFIQNMVEASAAIASTHKGRGSRTMEPKQPNSA